MCCRSNVVEEKLHFLWGYSQSDYIDNIYGDRIPVVRQTDCTQKCTKESWRYISQSTISNLHLLSRIWTILLLPLFYRYHFSPLYFKILFSNPSPSGLSQFISFRNVTPKKSIFFDFNPRTTNLFLFFYFQNHLFFKIRINENGIPLESYTHILFMPSFDSYRKSGLCWARIVIWYEDDWDQTSLASSD